MKSLGSKIKFRWKVAPLWVKMVDITCWCLLLSIILSNWL